MIAAVRWLWRDDRFFVANHLPPPDCDRRSLFVSFHPQRETDTYYHIEPTTTESDLFAGLFFFYYRPLSNLTPALPLPAGRGRRLGGGHLDPDREERLHQPAVLQDVRRLHLHTCRGRSCRHGNGRAGLLRHLQGAQEAAASGERLRHARSMSSGGARVSQSTEELTNCWSTIKAINQRACI